VTERFLPTHLDLDLSILKIGEVARVDLAAFPLDGSARHDFRQGVNKAARAEYGFEITRKADVPSIFPAQRAVSDAWRAARNGLEKGFSLGARPPECLAQFNLAVLGSGFIVSDKGDIVTNNHVVDGATAITVRPDHGREVTAHVVGTGPLTDIALIWLDHADQRPVATLSTTGSLRVSDAVVAVGNRFGLGGTVTSGIVSAMGRNINSGPSDSYSQTDAAIDKGNSGGPLFGTDGQVVARNTAIFSPSGGSVGNGLSVPAKTISTVVAQLHDPVCCCVAMPIALSMTITAWRRNLLVTKPPNSRFIAKFSFLIDWCCETISLGAFLTLLGSIVRNFGRLPCQEQIALLIQSGGTECHDHYGPAAVFFVPALLPGRGLPCPRSLRVPAGHRPQTTGTRHRVTRSPWVSTCR